MVLQFLGGAGTVTGSKYLLESGGTRILIDCGLFQGVKDLRLKNWRDFPVPPETIDAVILTHAHIDHSGYIPKLVRQGFKGDVISTPATKDLCRILLPDSGYLQEEEASYGNKKGFSKHHPALPLYTMEDAKASLESFRAVELNKQFKVGPFEITFREAGHILGAASVLIKADGKSLVFSGDVGRYDDLLMTPPAQLPEVDYVIMESTYGGQNHEEENTIEVIADILKDVIQGRKVLLIPSFAVGRAQTMLYIFHEIFEKHPELKVPVYVNSPMASDVTMVFRSYLKEHKLSLEECSSVCDVARFVNSVDESRALNEKKGPMVIISASGMLTGGRILHHLKSFGTDANNIILLVGFQAPGTRGYTITSGSRELKIHGQYYPIRAKVYQTNTLSAHADQGDLLKWLGSGKPSKIKKVYLVHGEPASSDALRLKIKDKMGLDVHIASLGEKVEI